METYHQKQVPNNRANNLHQRCQVIKKTQCRYGNLWIWYIFVYEASLFRCFLYFFHLFFFSPPPFLCRLEFISNQRASRELQLLITYSFAFLHINDCRVLVGFLPQWFKGTSVLCSPGRRRDGQRRGSKAVQSPHYPSWWELDARGIWDEWVSVVGGGYRGAQVIGQCPLST